MVPITALAQVSSIIDGTRELVSMVKSNSGNASGAQTSGMSSTTEQRVQNAFSTLMKEMDANKDGKLSRTEFGGEKSAFDKVDINQDGQLDASEIHKMITQQLNGGTTAVSTTTASQPTLSIMA